MSLKPADRCLLISISFSSSQRDSSQMIFRGKPSRNFWTASASGLRYKASLRKGMWNIYKIYAVIYFFSPLCLFSCDKISTQQSFENHAPEIVSGFLILSPFTSLCFFSLLQWIQEEAVHLFGPVHGLHQPQAARLETERGAVPPTEKRAGPTDHGEI